MTEEYIVGHDVGTGGNKAALINTKGDLIASTFEPYPISHPHPNWAEQDPNRWWEAVTGCTRQLVENSRVEPRQVIGLGFSGQMLSLVPVDSSGKALRKGIIWLDSRADEQAVRIVRRLFGERVVMSLAGAVPSGKDIVCKITWIKENEPDVFRDTYNFLDITGYLVARATGNLGIDPTGAGSTGLLSNRTRQWARWLARLVSTPMQKMPGIRSSIDVAGGLKKEAAVEMGLEPGTPVIVGLADIPSAATGSGALDDGDAHIYLGTSAWLCLSVSRPKNLGKNGIVSVASADPDMFIMIGESETAGACLKWFVEHFARTEEWARAGDEMAIFRVMDQVVEKVEPGSLRLIFTPWMFGERAPVTDTTLRGSFLNLGLEHGRDHLLRAIYEGVAYNLRWLLDAAGKAGFPCATLRAIGGGARSDIWMQIVADVTGRRVEAVENPMEAGAIGCALAAGVALGIYSDYMKLKEVVKVRRTFEPREGLGPLYDEMYDSFRSFYPGLSRAYRRMNRSK